MMKRRRALMIWLATMAALVAACAAETKDGSTASEGLPPFGGKGDFIGDAPPLDGSPLARWRGQSEFLSSAPSWDYGPIALESTARDAGGGDRKVEEADVYSYDADRSLLYALNAYRGLQVIDLADTARPNLIGRADLAGSPIEMFEFKGYAFVILNSFETDTDWESADRGAVLRVFDLADESNPLEVAEFSISGYVLGSRMLATDTGDSAVIYVASRGYSHDSADGTWESKTFIKSIDIKDPLAPSAVDEVTFAGSGNQIHVTPDAMFVTNQEWDSGRTTSTVTYVDISDYEGDIETRGEIDLNGSLSWGDRGELQLDYHEGYLRVATQVSVWSSTSSESHIEIAAIDTSDPDNLGLASAPLEVAPNERILACRFAGSTAYLFHAVNVDPLEIIDLADPAHPRSLSILDLPEHGFNGWVNHIEKRGDTLVTLGVESSDTNRKIALLLFDVADPTNPQLLDFDTAGQGWTWTSANWDIKSFTILDEQGLALVPVSDSSWDAEGHYSYRQWLQLFSFDLLAGTVEARGEILDVAAIKRAIPVADSVVTFNDRQLQVVDVTDADAPTAAAILELAADVKGFVTVGGFGAMVVGKGDSYNPQAELRMVSLHDPDRATPLAHVDLGSPAGTLRMLDAETLLHIGTDYNSGETVISVIGFDGGDPLSPVVTGTLRSAELGYNRWGGGIWWRPAPGPDYALVGNSLVMFTWANDDEEAGAKLRVVDLSDRTNPTEVATVNLGAATVADMREIDGQLFVSSYVPIEIEPEEGTVDTTVVGTADHTDDSASAASLLPGGDVWGPTQRSTTVAYSLRVVDLADPSDPTVSAAVSVPGIVVDKTQIDAWQILFTMDGFETEVGHQTAFDAMVFAGNKVRLLDVYGLPAGVETVQTDGDRAFFTESQYGYWRGPVIYDDADSDAGEPQTPKLRSLSMRYPDTLALAGEADLGPNVSYADLQYVHDGIAFATAGWDRVAVFDVSDAANMRQIDTIFTYGWFDGSVHVGADGRAYLPAGLYGLKVIRLP